MTEDLNDDAGSRPVTAPNPEPFPAGKQSDPEPPAVAALAEASGDPEAFRLVYSMLMRRYDDSARIGHMTQFADEVAAAAIQTLRDAGRLLPSDAPTWTEYGTQRADGGVFDAPNLDMALADEAHSQRHRYGPRVAVQRTVWVGPWVPVPTIKETPR